MKKYNVLKWIIFSIALAINIFILVNAFINGDVSAKESNSAAKAVADGINTIKPNTITKDNFPTFAFNLRKAVGHFGLFGLSGGFTTWALYLFVKEKKYGYFLWQLLMTFGFGITLAAVTELIQIGVAGRTGTFVDIGIDTLGYFCGVFLVFLILLIRKSQIFYRANYQENQAK